MKKFTEKQTRDYYNTDDELYRTFWNKEGNCHWGYFPYKETTFAQSMIELNKKMLSLSNINSKSTVLDVGCGNGNNSFFINQKSGAKVVGIDLSDVRIDNAKKRLAKSNAEIKKNLKFFQSSATKLNFKDSSFSDVWSQSTIYHVHQKEKALREIFRVLKKGGIFIFEDLIKPNKKVGKDAKKFVYERLFFNTEYSLVSYQQELQKLGFRVLFAEDMSWHYAMSYSKLADILEEKIKKGKNKEFHTNYKQLINAYRKTWEIMEKGDVGWALFMCKKI